MTKLQCARLNSVSRRGWRVLNGHWPLGIHWTLVIRAPVARRDALKMERATPSTDFCQRRGLGFRLGQEETEGGAHQQPGAQDAERDGDAAGLLLERADDVVARPAADVAKGVDQAHHGAQDVAGEGLGGYRPERRQPREWTRDG